MPKPARSDRPLKIRVSLPQSLIFELEAELYDEALQKTAYGARSALIEKLLRDWLRQRKGKKETDIERAVKTARSIT